MKKRIRDEFMRIRRGDVALVIDRQRCVFPECLVSRDAGVFTASAVTVTSVDRDTFRGKLTAGGAKMWERRDVIAVCSSVDQAQSLFRDLVAIENRARHEARASCDRIEAEALQRIERACEIHTPARDFPARG